MEFFKTIYSWLIISDIYLAFRIFVAGLCGFAIGYERKNRAKGAGIRTHFIVAASAALMMIISIYGFGGVGDPSRMAAQIVSGVGFLGAGMIFVQKQTVTGLTTAAGIWATSGVGMAIGAGMYFVGIFFTILLILAQLFMHSHISWLQTAKTKNIFVYGVEDENFKENSIKQLEKYGMTVSKVNVGYNLETSKRDYMFTVEISPKVDVDVIVDMFKNYSCKVKEKE